MADVDDDSESWFKSVLCHAELAAHQIARFRNPWWNPAWRDLVPDDPPPSRPAIAAGWGLRGKRSRPAAARFAKGEPAAAAACSPATPLDFRSGPGSGSAGASSTSGGETSSPEMAAAAGEKRRRVGDGGDVTAAGGGCETMVVGNERAPFVSRISAAKDIVNRRTGKKKTLCELQEEEKLLMEEKKQLKKEMELRMKAYDELWMEHQTLKRRQVVNSAKGTYKAKAAHASSSVPSSSTGFFLPDLNEPLSENLNSQK